MTISIVVFNSNAHTSIVLYQEMDRLTFVFGFLGNIVSFMVFLSPLPTFFQIYKKKSSEGFQSIPYVVGLFSATLWMYYAFLKPAETTLLVTINSVGCLFQSAYICFYLFYAPRNARVQTLSLLLLLNVAGLGLIVLLTHFFARESFRAVIVGWICLVFSLCVFVAPLCVVRQVIRTKSVEYMPFLLSFFLTLSAVMWFFYGLLLKDYNIAIPNVLGFIFGVLQMVLYVIYRKADKERKQKKQQLCDIGVEIRVNNASVLKDEIVDAVKLSSGIVAVEMLPFVPILDDDNRIEIITVAS